MAVELPNIIVLIGDPETTVIERLFTEEALEGCRKNQHISMKGGGSISGQRFCRRREIERGEPCSARSWSDGSLPQ